MVSKNEEWDEVKDSYDCMNEQFDIRKDDSDIWHSCVKQGFKNHLKTWHKCLNSAHGCENRIRFIGMQSHYSKYIRLWQDNWYHMLKRTCDSERQQLSSMLNDNFDPTWRCSLL